MKDQGAAGATGMRFLGPLAPRPRLAIALAAGLLIGVGVFAFTAARPSTAAIVGWDAACLTFIALALRNMARRPPDEIRRRAAADDEGRALILGLVIAAAVASIAAVALELSLARADAGVVKALRVWLAFATVAASWMMIQLIFALHYAHGYYDAADSGDAGGLAFPKDEEPDYWDFLHFALIIGVACQTADIAITSKSMRRLGSLHSLLAFAFNTVIVALTINMVASLF